MKNKKYIYTIKYNIISKIYIINNNGNNINNNSNIKNNNYNIVKDNLIIIFSNLFFFFFFQFDFNLNYLRDLIKLIKYNFKRNYIKF
jgi:hypothetical protein